MDQPVDGTLYSGPEACRAASISYRQLGYWDRTGVLKPTQPAQGSGSQRGYTFDEVVALAALGRLNGGGDTDNGPLPRGMLAAVVSGSEFVVVSPGYRQKAVGVRDAEALVSMVRAEAAVTVLALLPFRVQVGYALAPRRDMVGIH